MVGSDPMFPARARLNQRNGDLIAIQNATMAIPSLKGKIASHTSKNMDENTARSSQEMELKPNKESLIVKEFEVPLPLDNIQNS